jgi:hypothetical protein
MQLAEILNSIAKKRLSISRRGVPNFSTEPIYEETALFSKA